MLQTIGAYLPAAIAVALSPIPIIGVVLILATPRARTNGPAFAVGWVAGLSIVMAIVLVLARGTSNATADSTTSIDWVQVGLGVLFLGLAMKQWSTRSKGGEAAEMPAWMAKVDRSTPRTALLLGGALSGLNPKNLALTLSAGATIARAGLSSGDEVVAAAVFVALGSVTVAGAVLAYVIAPGWAAGPLGRIKDFMSVHNAVIMMVILVLLGLKLLADGLGGG